MVTEPKFKFRSLKLDSREPGFHDNINFPMQTLTCKGAFSLDHLSVMSDYHLLMIYHLY